MDECNHPGGLELTERAFETCVLPDNAKVLDVGCGTGRTAAWLKKRFALQVTGIDISPEAIALAKENVPDAEFFEGDGEFLDFPSYTFDCVLMECTLSLISKPLEAVHEAFCVLKDGGKLIISDLYFTGKAPENADGAGALNIDAIRGLLDELGFDILLFEDRKSDLVSYAASLIFQHGSLKDHYKTGDDKSKLSYFLLVASKDKRRGRG